MQYALTGDDTFILNDVVLNDLTDGSVVNITYSNDRIGISTGKNDNTVFSDNRQGGNASAELRVLRGSATDKFLNGLSVQQERDMVAFPVMNGSFSKRVGDGLGNISYDTFTLLGGMFPNLHGV